MHKVCDAGDDAIITAHRYKNKKTPHKIARGLTFLVKFRYPKYAFSALL